MSVINNPESAKFCGFCKSLRTEKTCTTINCPGPETPRAIDRPKIRKFQTKEKDIENFKKYFQEKRREAATKLNLHTNNNNSSGNTNNIDDGEIQKYFTVVCGTNTKVTTDENGKKKRETCQTTQKIIPDPNFFPFLIMEPSHKEGCPFKVLKKIK